MKQKKKAGLTMVELLCALAVLLLVAACMVVGVSLAVRSYDRSLASSEAQVLCATLQTTVSDELRYSGTLFYDQTGRLTGFFSQEHGGEDAKDGFQTDENGQILLGGTKLLPKKAYPHGLRAAVTVDYDRATRLFSVTVTVTDAQGTELSSTSFQVEKLNAFDEVVVGS